MRMSGGRAGTGASHVRVRRLRRLCSARVLRLCRAWTDGELRGTCWSTLPSLNQGHKPRTGLGPALVRASRGRLCRVRLSTAPLSSFLMFRRGSPSRAAGVEGREGEQRALLPLRLVSSLDGRNGPAGERARASVVAVGVEGGGLGGEPYPTGRVPARRGSAAGSSPVRVLWSRGVGVRGGMRRRRPPG